MLALRITPVEEDAERNERWRPWLQYGSIIWGQAASQQAEDRLSARVMNQPYLWMQVQSRLRRFGLCI